MADGIPSPGEARPRMTPGLSLRFAYSPKTLGELEAATAHHPCAACGKIGEGVAGDRGPRRERGPIHFFRAALRCKCGFTNFVQVIVNDVPSLRPGNVPSTREALEQAESQGQMPDPAVEELLVEAAAAAHREDWEGASSLASACVDRAPESPAAWYNVGWLRAAGGQWEDSREAYLRVLDLSEEFPSALLNLGSVLKEMGRPQEALTYLNQFLEAYPGDARALRLVAGCKDASEVTPRPD